MQQPIEQRPGDVLLDVRNLQLHFPIRGGLLRRKIGTIKIVDDLTFMVRHGETFTLVGGPSCGKTLAGRAILQLIKPTGGSVIFKGAEIVGLRGGGLRTLRQETQMVFQDPYRSLNPRMLVGKLVGEPLQIHNLGAAAERDERVAALLQQVGLNPYVAERPPFDMSGLQRKRVNLARALASQPIFLLVDDPLYALDEVVHGQMMALLAQLKAALGLTYMLTSRTLAHMRQASDAVGVMYLGRMVEQADTAELYDHPLHPYTHALLSELPLDSVSNGEHQRLRLSGREPNPAKPPSGCPFHPRCPHTSDVCRRETPPLRDLGTAVQPHWVACHYAERFL
ncbi:MAG: ATP-binding cassette domain-containing protein [Ardenticatenaceae bacterium]|nr:ATP-binding cassette domain-containing protein [Anaerolineales bacterium]MCB8923217.1 ATP-binding cassette domain-containing protein [Ardenticatenaceae bacterium]MCB9004838.1 ATP-binding cassette domain-containing protein [Ardenticatenaceae bacterium]